MSGLATWTSCGSYGQRARSRGGFGSSDNAFGTPGAGGSFGFADPDTGIGFAYAMNRAGFHLYNDPRELALRQVLFRDIVGARSQT